MVRRETRLKSRMRHKGNRNKNRKRIEETEKKLILRGS